MSSIRYATLVFLLGATGHFASAQTPANPAATNKARTDSGIVANWSTTLVVPRDNLSNFLGWAQDIAFDPTGETVAIQWQNEVQTWSIAGTKRLAATTIPTFADFRLLPDGSGFLQSGKERGTYDTLDFQGQKAGSYKPTLPKKSYTERFNAGGFGPNGHLFYGLYSYSNGKDTIYRIHSINGRTGEGQPVTGTLAREHYENCKWIVPVPGGKTLLACCGKSEGKSEIWSIDLASGEQKWVLTLSKDAEALIHKNAIGLSPDGKWLVLSKTNKSYSSDLLIYDWQAGKKVSTLDLQPRSRYTCRFTPDGQRIVILSIVAGKHTLSLFDAASGKPLGSTVVDLRGEFGHMFGISPDGKRLGVAEQSTHLEEINKKVTIVQDSRVFILDFERAFGVAPLAVTTP